MLRSRRFYIDVPVEISDVVGELSTEELIEELKSRGKKPQTMDGFEDGLKEVREAIRDKRFDDAEAALDRIIWPKFRSIEDCEQAYTTTKGISRG